MKDELHHQSSADTDMWTWIILAGLLVLGFLVAMGSLALMSMNQQGQTATGSQTTPSR